MQELALAGTVVEAVYETPMAAHLAMEPQNATAKVGPDSADIWVSTQQQSLTRTMVAQVLALPEDKVTVHTLRVGGGFGRRLEYDAAVQAARIARATGLPVKLIWSREQDVRHDFMRPPAVGRYRAALGSDAMDVVGPSLMASSGNRHPVGADGIDFTAMMGLQGPYEWPVPSRRWTRVEGGMRSGWWRSVGASSNTFFIESFVDELALAAGSDAVAFRRLLLANTPRALTLLETLVQRAGLGHPAATDRWHGFAIGGRGQGTLAALAVEISTPTLGRRELRIERMVVVLDCGLVINPRLVQAQVKGSVAWGLSGCLLGEITATEGAVDQSGFHDYPVIDMARMPTVDVYLSASQAEPSGAGEDVVPLVAPALANAIFRASGERLRALPFGRGGWSLA